MNHFSIRCLSACMLGFVVLAVSPSTHADDKVYVKQGPTAQGKINELTPVKVTIEVKGKEQVYSLKDVRKIAFDKEPPQLDRAREFAMDGKYQQALDELRGLQRGTLEGKVLQDFDFYRWYAEGNQSLAGSGDQVAAIRGLIAFDKETPDSHHKFEIKELLGRLALATAKFDNAKVFFEALEQSPELLQKATGAYSIANVLYMQGKTDEAKAKIKGLLTVQTTSPEMGRLKSLAAVLDARCENQLGNSQQALSDLNAMADREDNTDLQLFAKINNARGECNLKLNQPSSATNNFLQTDLLFFADPESHAEALFHLKSLLVTVGEPAKAAQAAERLRKQYASSFWASKK